MKRTCLILLTALMIISRAILFAESKPRIAILATGGTIAGAASAATQASYIPGVVSLEQIISSVPDLTKLAHLNGIQVCNISSQNITPQIWLRLCRWDCDYSRNGYNGRDSLFSESYRQTQTTHSPYRLNETFNIP
jgi:L-asparaginase